MKFSKVVLALGSALLSFSTFADIPNSSHTTTFVGPTAKLGFTSTLNNSMAYNLAGEVGVNNFRVGGTWGWKIAEAQRLKLSADYLWQEISYAFFSGDTDQWVRQFSISGAYQYDLVGIPYNPQLDIDGYYAYAPSKRLSTKVGTYTNAFGLPTSFVDYRHIAGSDAWGLAPGISITPWIGGRVGIELNYDNVDYKQKYSTPNYDTSGLGGTFRWKQLIIDNLGVNLSAAIRRPFNNYAAELNWFHVPYYGDWTLGIFANYTAGKYTLPNTWNAGVSANYMLDKRCPAVMPSLKGEAMAPIVDNLLAWTSKPAVYIPQVLAIPDGRAYTFTSCVDGGAPTFSGPISGDSSSSGTIDATPFFSGNNLIFSLASISPALEPDDSVLVSPSGLLSWEVEQGYSVVIRATNSCGTAISNEISLDGGIE